MHGSINFGDDRVVARVTSFEELDDARQTAGDVLGLGRTRDPREHVARMNFLPVVHHDVSPVRSRYFRSSPWPL